MVFDVRAPCVRATEKGTLDLCSKVGLHVRAQLVVHLESKILLRSGHDSLVDFVDSPQVRVALLDGRRHGEDFAGGL